jgi:hypothetical protein
MAGREEQRGPAPDDWFDEPTPRHAPAAAERERDEAVEPTGRTGDEDDWLGGGDAQPRSAPRRGPWDSLSERGRRFVWIGAALVVLLLAGLALGGVFSSSKPRPAAATTTAPGVETTTPATNATKPPRAAAPTVPLKRGDTGAQVKLLQRALASLGYYSTGTVDGSFGPSTENAVVRFQRSVGLTADGVVGQETLSALRTALAAR